MERNLQCLSYQEIGSIYKEMHFRACLQKACERVEIAHGMGNKNRVTAITNMASGAIRKEQKLPRCVYRLQAADYKLTKLYLNLFTHYL